VAILWSTQWLRVVLDLANGSGRFPPKDREYLSNLATSRNIFLSTIFFVRDHCPKSRWHAQGKEHFDLT